MSINKILLHATSEVFIEYLILHNNRLGVPLVIIEKLKEYQKQWRLVYLKYSSPKFKTKIIVEEINNLAKLLDKEIRGVKEFLRNKIGSELEAKDYVNLDFKKKKKV